MICPRYRAEEKKKHTGYSIFAFAMQHLPHEPLVRSVAARKLVQIIKASIFAAQKFHYPTGYPVSQKARRLASVAWAFFRTLSNQVVVVVVVHALDLDCSLGHVAPTSYTLGAPTTTLDSIFFRRRATTICRSFNFLWPRGHPDPKGVCSARCRWAGIRGLGKTPIDNGPRSRTSSNWIVRQRIARSRFFALAVPAGPCGRPQMTTTTGCRYRCTGRETEGTN